MPSFRSPGVALILGIDRFMSEARAITNFIGNGVATLVTAKWCHELNEVQLHRALAGETLEIEEAEKEPRHRRKPRPRQFWT